MANIIELTQHPAMVVANSPADQILPQALDVLAYDIIDLELRVAFDFISGYTPSLSMAILTGMQMRTTDGWIQAAAFATGSSLVQKLTLSSAAGSPFLRYLRWSVTALTSCNAVRFTITGVGRRFCCG